jgi:hypothetical protein
MPACAEGLDAPSFAAGKPSVEQAALESAIVGSRRAATLADPRAAA